MKATFLSRKYISALTIILLVMSASCKKYIYQAPINSTYSEKFWTYKTSVEQGANSMYLLLRNGFTPNASFFITGDLVTGSFVSSDFPQYNLRASLSPAFNFANVPGLENSLQNWSRFYRVIAQANIMLKNVNAMSTSIFSSTAEKNTYLGEALFMRAFTYFYIIRNWGDPIYVSKIYDDVDYGNIPPIARTPEKIVLDSCIADLKIAATYLNYVDGDVSKVVRANKGTVYALLAHIYAWRHDYANTHLACQELINNGGYTLEPIETYKDIWAGQSSLENIWEIAMKAIGSNISETSFDFFGTFLKNDYVNGKKSSSWVSPIGGFVDQMIDTAKDKRYKLIFTHVPSQGYNQEGYMLLKYTDFEYKDAGTQSDPYLNNNLVIFRLSDIILLDAEARSYTNDLAGAKNMLALTEDRAGISNYKNISSQYDVTDEVVMERGRELIGEGQWFYDLIRTDSTQGWLGGQGYPLERVKPINKGYYWPLDMATLFPQDHLLTQNPWWAKNN